VHFSSASCEWSTPPELFADLDREFGFTLDVCATADNAKCSHFYSRAEDGLRQPWTGRVWCNPPYGRSSASGWSGPGRRHRAARRIS
jgi:site-specific DNA-methyltransferase (adenine-specific)